MLSRVIESPFTYAEYYFQFDYVMQMATPGDIKVLILMLHNVCTQSSCEKSMSAK